MKNNQYVRQAQYKKGFVNIILIAVLVLVVGVVSYSAWSNKSTQSNNQPVSLDWQTYTNEEYGFEFKYPKDWTFSEYQNQITFNTGKEPKDYPYNVVTIHVQENQARLSLMEWIKNNYRGEIDFSITPIKSFTNQSGIIFAQINSIPAEDSDNVGSFALNNQNVVFVVVDPASIFLPVYSQILSTFRFTGNDKMGRSGIQGTITIGPTCGVERFPQDPKCADKPYKTKIRIVKDDTDFVVFAESDIYGNFSIDLGPALYHITVPGLDKQIPSLSDTQVAVSEGKYTEVKLQFDSGIR